MRLPRDVLAQDPRTIYARACPKVTDGGHPARGPGVKQRLPAPGELRAPRGQPRDEADGDPGGEYGQRGGLSRHVRQARRQGFDGACHGQTTAWR